MDYPEQDLIQVVRFQVHCVGWPCADDGRPYVYAEMCQNVKLFTH